LADPAAISNIHGANMKKKDRSARALLPLHQPDTIRLL
jgi:hypothetical protein